jgi:hypothetical protein
MIRCPNCDYAVEQLGAQTNCAKCGKRLTVKCIVCEMNNPPVFQHCLKCGTDYRFHAVEHFSKRLAKVEFELKQYELTAALKVRATLVEQIGTIAVSTFTIIIGLFCWLFRPEGVYLILLLSIPLLCCTLTKLFGKRLALMTSGLPSQFPQEWPHICSKAKRQKAERDELSKQLRYYQQELNQFRHKGPTSTHPH